MAFYHVEEKLYGWIVFWIRAVIIFGCFWKIHLPEHNHSQTGMGLYLSYCPNEKPIPSHAGEKYYFGESRVSGFPFFYRPYITSDGRTQSFEKCLTALRKN